MCQRHTEKAQSTRQKGSPSAAHGEDPTATGQTTNTLFAVCPLSGTRQRLHRAFLTTHGEKKKRRRDDRETAGNDGVDGFAVSQIRSTANNFKKIKKSTSCPHRRPHPWCRRRRDERQGSRRRMEGEEAAAGGHRAESGGVPDPSPPQFRPPCAVYGGGSSPAVRRRGRRR